MKLSIQQKLSALIERHEELQALLGDASVIGEQKKFRELSKEYSQLEPVVQAFKAYQLAVLAEKNANELLKDADPEMRELAQIEFSEAKKEIERLENELQVLLLPKDPNDDKNIFLEIRAGTGGDEASIFSGDLLRMYTRYAETQGWSVEMISESDGEHGGFKEVVARLSGDKVYSKLKFESGAHRVQRVPETEAQGRIHTSACTVAIMPEVDAIDEFEIKSDELRIDTYRASGAGGQHVNRTDSAVRITHIPTGTVVECQDERSQHKNKARAMSLLQARLLASVQAAQKKEQSETRRNLVGSGDRSERIRTYNYPQGRVTDHRINLTLYQLPDIMEGKLDEIINALIQEHQADLLATIGDN